MKMGNLPRGFTLRLWKKLKHTLPGRKLLGLECCMPELRLSESACFLLVYTAPREGRDCHRGASGAVPKSGRDHQAPHLEQSRLVCPGRTQASMPPEQGATPHMQEGGWVWIPDPFSSHRRRPDGVRGNRAHKS